MYMFINHEITLCSVVHCIDYAAPSADELTVKLYVVINYKPSET